MFVPVISSPDTRLGIDELYAIFSLVLNLEICSHAFQHLATSLAVPKVYSNELLEVAYL